jgi:ketosteroid isomerase-like protein
MKIFSFLLTGVIFLSSAFAQTKDEIAVRNILSKQTTAWNTGNVDAFMQGYWQSDSLMFIGKSGVTYGWQKTLDNYKKNYPDATAMGKLNFTILQTKRLSMMYYFVVGKWHLARTIGDLNGHFTLLFKKIKNTWVIISDHSS